MEDVRNDLVEQYKQLWIETFGDTREFVDDIFAISQPCIIESDGQVASALLRIRFYLCYNLFEHVKADYIYGVVTNPAFRGQGYATRLLSQAHEEAQREGVKYCFLVAADEGLQKFYMDRGYSPAIPKGEGIFPRVQPDVDFWLLTNKYGDPLVEETVQFIALSKRPVPKEITAIGLLSH